MLGNSCFGHYQSATQHGMCMCLLRMQGRNDAPPPAHVVSQIREAASQWGFFQLVNHGVSQQLLDEHYEATKRCERPGTFKGVQLGFTQ